MLICVLTGFLTPYIVKYLNEPETNTVILENKKNTIKVLF